MISEKKLVCARMEFYRMFVQEIFAEEPGARWQAHRDPPLDELARVAKSAAALWLMNHSAFAQHRLRGFIHQNFRKWLGDLIEGSAGGLKLFRLADFGFCIFAGK